ncbi:MAG: Holliday junction branch migration protein RuvA [Chloroflexota bacterium]
MIAGLRGVLEARTAEYALVGVGGLTFKVYAPTSTLAELGSVGEQVKLHTHLYAREDNLSLYGFVSEAELKTFELLLTVSGIGPRGALNILSAAPLETLCSAVASGDAAMLTRIPGIGRKTAERLIVELRGKIDTTGLAVGAGRATVGDDEVTTALVNLGYSIGEAQAAVRSLPAVTGLSLEERIVLALRHFGEKR